MGERVLNRLCAGISRWCRKAMAIFCEEKFEIMRKQEIDDGQIQYSEDDCEKSKH